MTGDHIPVRKLLWVILFGIGFGFIEAGVVVYLRALYYPEGFSFPLKVISGQHLAVELAREASTILVLIAVGVIAGTRSWLRFGFFLVAFGIWDIFYYVWLKLILNWPAALTDWDILFLIPVPWTGPVIAPFLISFLMCVCGIAIIVRVSRGLHFHPTVLSWAVSLGATAIALYSFMSDPSTSLQGTPAPYRYSLLIVSLLLYCVAFVNSCTVSRSRAR
jgi:hypothetical protein